MKLLLEGYDNDTKIEEYFPYIQLGKQISISYDGGRLYLYIGDKEIFKTYLAGNDWSLELNQ